MKQTIIEIAGAEAPVFFPTVEDVLKLGPGHLAPNCFGQLAPVAEVFARGRDVEGRWFACYYVHHGDNGGMISESIKEGEIVRTVPLSSRFDSWQITEAEKQLRQRAGRQ